MGKLHEQVMADATKLIAGVLTKAALPGDLGGFGPEARANAARFAAEALAQRAPGEASLVLDTLSDRDGRRHMRLAIVNADSPFLVDSVCAAIAARGLTIERLLHPVIGVARDASGAFSGKGADRESLIYIETDRADARTRADLRSALIEAMAHVRAAVRDWPAMKAALANDAATLSGEAAALIGWIADNNFTLLGRVRFHADQKPEAKLGLARGLSQALLSAEARAIAFARLSNGDEPILVIKSNLLSPVHRRAPLDLIIVPVREGQQVVALSIHAGLWTSASLAAPPEAIPVLRERLSALQRRYRFDPAGHAGKALSHACATLPHDILISIAEADMERIVLTAMSIADRPRAKLELAAAPLDRHLFAFVWLPRDELSTGRREALAAMLCEAAGARLLSWTIELGDGEAALLRYTLDLRQGGSIPDARPLDVRTSAMVRGWSAAVETALGRIGDKGQATRLALRYAEGFPEGYRQGAGADEAARDIVELHALADAGRRRVRFYGNPNDPDTMLRVKLYSLDAMALSDCVPALENFGFRVVEELSTPLEGGKGGHIQKYILEAPAGKSGAALVARGDDIAIPLARVLEGKAENDPFNQLIAALGLDAAGVVLVRALFRYLRQTGMTYGLGTVVQAFRHAPEVALAIGALFRARHDPGLERERERRIGEAETAIRRGLDRVAAIDEDRILRGYRAVVMATLRTNAFSPAAHEALAFKIDSAQVPGLPDPKPWREIFVYSPRVEGIHLRAGPIARGGLRWSDRRDDFRTEVLGLMKAQRVKNAVIVPTGAKGGFYPKHLPDPANREAWLAEGTECYRIFIRSLLSVTDNLVNGEVVHPAQVVRHDADDPYFVVAADKGTATFSDVANAIALERGFWLGDAFASGGSVGYDHKAMGITAKGAWISVQRHFAEAGVNVQIDPVRVAGCGDMSGDVFGNGMLLSKSIRLVAAFDHRHFFFDPDPDPAISWKERSRMFKLPRSSWADYDTSLISKGGGAWPRSAKSIPLSKPVRALLGVTDTAMEPSALIAAILKSPVDLLWFGGIGTYVKARSESHGEVGDRANDAHRVNAEDVRARAIGEGANLGVTQAGRIAFAARGGRVNADFIDNSAGVDCSDNEVNIKIALNADVASGALAMPDRDALLARMTDDVSALVLEDNRLQTLALSIAQRGGAAGLPAFVRLIETFEAEGRLDRVVEGLAANDELFRRAAGGQGLTRPELAVILATAKLSLQDAIERGGFAPDPLIDAELIAAFPPAMRERHHGAILGHRLRTEIVATKLANRIVNRMGAIHPFELAEEEGVGLHAVALAFVAVEQLHDLPALWRAIERADLPEDARLMAFDQLAIELRVQMSDMLRSGLSGAMPDAAVSALRSDLAALSIAVDDVIRPETRGNADNFGARLVDAGLPKRLADAVVALAKLDGAIGLAALAARRGLDVVALARAFTALGAALGLDWAQGAAMRLAPSDPWERLLAAGLARDFQAMRLDFLSSSAERDPEAQVQQWIESRADAVDRFRRMIARARESAHPSTAMLAQIAAQTRDLFGTT